MQTAVIEALAPRFHHIHMRVGYDHGPQVPDPRAAKWLPYTEGHERWWDAIQAAAERRGAEEVTVTTEFGPPNYQVRGGKIESGIVVWGLRCLALSVLGDINRGMVGACSKSPLLGRTNSRH